jgi:predicted transcriptional regulator
MSGAGRDREVSDDAILRAIALHPDPVVTASEVAEEVGITPQGVNKRLKQLVEKERLTRKEVGSRAVIYWLTDEQKKAAFEP